MAVKMNECTDEMHKRQNHTVVSMCDNIYIMYCPVHFPFRPVPQIHASLDTKLIVVTEARFHLKTIIVGDIVYASEDSGEESEEFPMLQGTDRVYFADLNDVFFRKPEATEIGKKGQQKKECRVYKNKHACFYCAKLVAKPVEHLEGQHAEETEVKRILSLAKDDNQRKGLLTLLRNKGNHRHNLTVVSEKRGELLMSRRPTRTAAPLLVSSYMPCPSCFAWVQDIAKHRSFTNRCVSNTEKLTKRAAILLSSTQLGRHTEASEKLQREVMSKMAGDSIGCIAREDALIVQIGNDTIMKNLKNTLQRGSYASCKMRLCARILQRIREIAGDVRLSWQQVLAPQHFKLVVKAVAFVSGATGDSFEHPSNALKAGYHVKELANIKEALAVMERNKEEAEDARDFLLVCRKNWVTEISAVACATLTERTFNKLVDLPRPADLQRLSQHLQREAGLITSIDDEESYRHAVEVTQARLLTYNKRRPGELQSIK